ncbi:GNAT family N-acetyltransferase [Luteolibacter luteus]|uniref:GNAT family N-acetyltransferase n=1 Tax=Luteolibacter luteus TaxID=2728835 RepID=A0A858RPA8_9BACT|nr:GNAT family N-acetyltransferase [Luteolibacter luteus]QJE98179.1 GNAT family N-acetyltransferase [Luteolibacter luteus]
MSSTHESPKKQAPLIRRATPADAGAIEALYRELVSDPSICVQPDQITTLESSSSSFLLVAELGGKVYGTAHLNLCADVMYRQQPYGVIENVIVATQLRGHGIGRLLLQEAERLALEHDCSKLMLLSSASRTSAHEFFHRCGFASDTKRAFVKYRRQFAPASITEAP